MTDINTREQTATINIKVVTVGQGHQFIQLPEGSLGKALLEQLGVTSGRHVTAGGVEVQADTPLRDGLTACVAPKAVKQGS